ncbi:heterokaryon incompatibility protein-domain-containing protein [Halenospora varia]|nr:heterokaryon incompatibility protein-domain-containing protein [Halenospora varia]
MRLINAQTLELEEFFGDQIPEYAILSHTWGPPKDEVSFQDMTSKNFEHKAGIRKIRFLCQQALQDDLVWTWCDTCCINKDSSAELSEAINSMFQWYQDAKICYAYLSDVDASANLDATTSSRFSVPPEFSISRWFSRGWTLQELLAPEEVIFFARDWICIGRKKELFWLIRRITGIHRGALEWPWTISSYSVATRISWAARRKTTRTEDRAYSLLGILGVHMPLLYGEARNAFKRLQTELIKISDDESFLSELSLALLRFSKLLWI